MGMGLGLWYNPQADKDYDLQHITHDQWLRDRRNAQELGISSETQWFIANTRNIDLIRLAATMEGMVRIRDHFKYISVQIYVERGIVELLNRICLVLERRNFSKSDPLIIDNLRTNESIEITLALLRMHLTSNLPVLLKEISESDPTSVRDHHLAEIVRQGRKTATKSSAVTDP